MGRVAAGHGGLRREGVGRVAAEVVLGVEGASHGGVQLRVPVVGTVDDGERVSGGVVQGKMELAVLGSILDRGAGADVGLETIEPECDNLRSVLNQLTT